MENSLVIRVQFHEGRYHGSGNWPPSPARLFQALLAGATLQDPLTPERRQEPPFKGLPLSEESPESSNLRRSLKWLETLPPPFLGAPVEKRGQKVGLYVPSNDRDQIHDGKIRFKKIEHPWLFDETIPLLYIWPEFPDAAHQEAASICALADGLYQLGRGLDMAWAYGEILDAAGLEDLLTQYLGCLYYPTGGYGGRRLACPIQGSLDSLLERHDAGQRRFGKEGKGRSTQTTLRLPPPVKFREIAYESPPARHVYELCSPLSSDSFAPWPLVEAAPLVEALRNEARCRLERALPLRTKELEQAFGTAGGTGFGPAEDRIRIIPLPSIGHPHADRWIRRVLLEIPPSCPLQAGDVAWAFSGLELTDAALPFLLVASSDARMLRHYGVGSKARTGPTEPTKKKHPQVWRTVTPVALPEETDRTRTQQKRGSQRDEEERRLRGHVLQALRYVHIQLRPETIHVQREPFEGGGERAEAFVVPENLSAKQLWHVELQFASAISGPLLLGEGRFHGLGVMAPVSWRGEESTDPKESASSFDAPLEDETESEEQTDVPQEEESAP